MGMLVAGGAEDEASVLAVQRIKLSKKTTVNLAFSSPPALPVGASLITCTLHVIANSIGGADFAFPAVQISYR